MSIAIRKVSELSDEQLKELGVLIPDKGPGIAFTIGDELIGPVPIKCIPYKATRYLKGAYQDMRAVANDPLTYDNPDIVTEFLWMIIEQNDPAERPFKNVAALQAAADPDQLKDLHTKCFRLMYEPSKLLPKRTQDFLASQAPVREIINDPRLKIMLAQLPVVLNVAAELKEVLDVMAARIVELESWRESMDGSESASPSTSTPSSEAGE